MANLLGDQGMEGKDSTVHSRLCSPLTSWSIASVWLFGRSQRKGYLYLVPLGRAVCPWVSLSLLQNNRRSPGRDINVTGVWERNVTGRGVTVVVVDDGVEHTVQDIAPNYVSGLE